MTHIEFFIKFIKFLEENNIEYWLMCGTLLGAIRDGNFLKGDIKDTDIGVDISNYWKIRKLIGNHPYFRFLSVWRREVSVGSEIDKYKVDIFFMEKEKNNYTLYSYKPDFFTKQWNIEWKCSYDYKDFFPLKTFSFLDYQVNIPKRYKQILSTHYGYSWKKPCSDWDCFNPPHKETQYRPIAIIIPHFLRLEKTIKEIESILSNLDNDLFRIYVGNQNKESLLTYSFFKELQNKGHKVFDLPFNCGLAYTRNFLIKQTQEPLILIIDNDFEFTTKTDLNIFINILNESSDIGLVGGTLSNRDSYTHNLYYDKLEKKIYYIKHKPVWANTIPTLFQKQYTYYYCDSVLNFFLAKKEIFNDITWDNDLKLVEHTDFMLRLKNTDWRVAYTPEVFINHQEEDNSQEYIDYRQKTNKLNSLKLFLKKYNLASAKDIVQISESSFVVNIPETGRKSSAPAIDIIKRLKNKKYQFWLLGKSCLEAIKIHNLSLPIEIGINSEATQDILEDFTAEEVKILIDNRTRFKTIGVGGETVYVPYPVVKYLETTFNKSWEELQNE